MDRLVLESDGGLWTLFVSAFISSTLAPGGSEALLAIMSHQHLHPSHILLLTATGGNTLGAMTTFGLGYLLHKGYSVGRLSKRLSDKHLSHVKKWGTPILLLSWLPIIGDAFCFAAGWLRLALLPALAAITTGKLLRYAAIIYLFD